MSLVTYRRSNLIGPMLNSINSSNGFTSVPVNSFLGQIVGAVRKVLTEEFNTTYDIASNVDIGRASGTFLDMWGNLLGEERNTTSYAMDLSLSNVLIYLDPQVNAGDITSDGNGLFIPARTVIKSSFNNHALETLDDAYIQPDNYGVFVRVISINPGEVYISPESMDILDFNMMDIDNVSASVAREYTLSVINSFQISGGNIPAIDSLYRYILMEKSKSIGIYNENKVNTLMDIPEIVNIVIRELQGSVYIYLDVQNVVMLNTIIEIANKVIKNQWIKGFPIKAYPPLLRRIKLELILEVTQPDMLLETKTELITAISDRIVNTTMGDIIDLNDIVLTEAQPIDNIISVKITKAFYNNRELINYSINQQYNERAIISPTDIEII
jgi:hypothetical protein